MGGGNGGMECWSNGVMGSSAKGGRGRMEYWSGGVMEGRISLPHYSIAPLLHCCVLEDPGVLAAAALGGVDYEGTGPESHSSQTARNDCDLFSVQDEGPQVEVTSLHGVVAKSRRPGKRDNWLGNIIARILFYLFPKALAFRFCGLGTNEHSVTAALVHRFDYELGEMLENVSEILRYGGEISRDVWQDGIFAQVVANHLGHEMVNRLVIGNAGPNGIGETDISVSIRCN